MMMAMIRFNPLLQRKLTKGFSNMATTVAKISGTMMSLPAYKIANKATIPSKMDENFA
jgi:hypothetical protein